MDHVLSGSSIAISVVVPFFNEEEVLDAFVDQVTAVLGDDQSWELLLVDDGSSDRTAELMAIRADRDERVRLQRRLSSGHSVYRVSASAVRRAPSRSGSSKTKPLSNSSLGWTRRLESSSSSAIFPKASRAANAGIGAMVGLRRTLPNVLVYSILVIG